MNSPLSKLWSGRCTVSVNQDVTDPLTHQTTHQLSSICTNEPCRLSFASESTTNIETGAATLSQSIKLFIRPDLSIPPGSVIEVTQNGRTGKFKRSSTSAVYTNHQEISLVIDEDKA